MKRLVDQAVVIVSVIVPALNFQRPHKAAHLKVPLCNDMSARKIERIDVREDHPRTLSRYEDLKSVVLMLPPLVRI
jgi:hypothetical protein